MVPVKFIKLCLLVVSLNSVLVSTQDYNITIPLNKTITYRNKELYSNFVYLNRSSTLQVNFVNIGKNISFIIFQVHSHLYNVTLYKNIIEKGGFVEGTNVGLHSDRKKLDMFHVLNNNDVDLKLFIAVQGYGQKAPVPGGCNMEFTVPISPFMRVYNNRDYLLIDAAPPGIDVECLYVKDLTLHFYMVYLPQQNIDSDVYFDAIANMTTYDNIRRTGKWMDELHWPNRRMVSAYRGTGAVYVAIAHNGPTDYSVYVPAQSYGCSPLVQDDCDLLGDSLSELMCASLFFIGLFICYFGHRFFKTHTFFVGFLSGLVVTYVLISLFVTMDRSALVFASAISGLCIGAFRVVAWWIYGIPVFSIIMTSIDVGFLTAALLYYVAPGSLTILQVDLNFWPIFVFITLLVTILLLSVSFMANLICCAILGAYTTIYPIDFYLGSNMKYILINVIRRATVSNFNKALIMPVFQWKDCFLTFAWIGLAISGFVYQYYDNKGRPPFPPPPRAERPLRTLPRAVAGSSGYRSLSRHASDNLRSTNERTPLLA